MSFDEIDFEQQDLHIQDPLNGLNTEQEGQLVNIIIELLLLLLQLNDLALAEVLLPRVLQVRE